jgi:hypothetical protein
MWSKKHMVMGLCTNGGRIKSGMQNQIISRKLHPYSMKMNDLPRGNNVFLFRMQARSHSVIIVGKELPMEQISARFVGQNFIGLAVLPDMVIAGLE